MSAQPIPGPYTFDPDAGSIESADGVIVATISSPESFPCRDTEKDDEFEAELAATGHVLAAASEMLAALRTVEWAAETDADAGGMEIACPCCGNAKRFGHGRFCSLATAIAKAEGRS